MSYYNEQNCGYRDSVCGNGWGVGLSAIIGGALGYWAGRSGNPDRGPAYPTYAAPPAAYAV
jgi:hypothetical protein